MTNSQRLNCNEFRRGFLRLQGFGARTGQGCFEIADSQNRPVPEIRPNIQKKKNPKCHSQSQDWNTQKHTGPKPPCYRSFQKSASDSDSVLYRATRDSAQLGDSRLGRLGDSANPGPRGSRRGTWSGTDLRRRWALRWSTGCSMPPRTGRLAGTAGLKRHISITMELPQAVELSRLCLTSLVMLQKAWP